MVIVVTLKEGVLWRKRYSSSEEEYRITKGVSVGRNRRQGHVFG
ncbi:hypothetical protein EDC54_107110 [Samsonia erythrinae]|uniref:Uncharacterized protein n=1 Tax=Samsonia erythrinae TaxID=160434 RepID=A0A4R3VHU3_9GAMM|nr:hypothetical protein EDC54_107110 [Samsonia erythrinae]